MENLSFDNILDDEQIVEEVEQTEKEETPKEKENIQEITEIEDLDQSESVSDDEDNKETEDADESENQGTSPITFSSIAKAFAEEGIFPDLEDSEIEKAATAEGFAELVRKQINSRLDETQKRINDALEAGVEVSEIQSYENTLRYLNSISEDSLAEESKEAEETRKKLIYQDFINKGVKKERAIELMNRSIANHTDIEDAKEALSGNLEYFGNEYTKLIDDAKASAKREKEEVEARKVELKKSILEDNKFFEDLNVDKSTRQRIYENISKPVYKDKDTGNVYTAVQKYEKENPNDFLKYVGLCYTLTEGFTKMDKMIGGAVKKEVKKGLKALESKLSNTARTSDGRLDFLSGINDPESRQSTKISLDF